MNSNSNVMAHPAAESSQANEFFSRKLSVETDCSDVYADIKQGHNDFVLLDVRSAEAFNKSHAITALNMPSNKINEAALSEYPKNTLFVVYCWGPGCNGATKAAVKISALGFAVKEMIGGIQYWEDFERYPVNRYVEQAQS